MEARPVGIEPRLPEQRRVTIPATPKSAIPLIKSWEVVLLAFVGAFVGAIVGFFVGWDASEFNDAAAFGDALLGAALGGVIGLGLGFLAGSALRRAKPNQ